MIDWSRVAILRADIGPDDFEEIIALFFEEVEEGITRLDRSKPATLEAELHFLKGSALNLGFATFAQKCAAGELLASSEQHSAIDIPAIVGCYRLSKAALLVGLETANAQ